MDDTPAPTPALAPGGAPSAARRWTEPARLRWLLAAALVVLGAGLWAFVLRGADGPEDPVVQRPTAASLPGDPDREAFGGFGEVAIKVDPAEGGDSLLWCLLAAIDPEQRSRGLMEVTDLQGYDGMAFVYDQPSSNDYHMRNVPRALSIAWIDGLGRVVSTRDMEPCAADAAECPTYASGGEYTLAVEVFQGGLDELGISPGATVDVIGGGCQPTDG